MPYTASGYRRRMPADDPFSDGNLLVDDGDFGASLASDYKPPEDPIDYPRASPLIPPIRPAAPTLPPPPAVPAPRLNQPPLAIIQPPLAPKGTFTEQEYAKLGPPPEPPKPKWWQRLAAGALGAAAGYSAASHPNSAVDPATLARAESAIKQPGYSDRLMKYQQQKKHLEEQLAQEDRQKGRELQQEQIESLKQERQARAAQLAATKPTLTEKASELKRLGFTDREIRIVLSGGHLAPEKDDDAWGISKEVADRYGITPRDDGKYYAPKQAVGTLVRTEGRSDEDSVTEGKLALRAARGDEEAKRALDLLARQKQATHPAKEPSAGELSRQRQEKIRSLAQRAMRDSRSGGGAAYDDAIQNVQKFYADDPDMDEYREDVIAHLNKWKMAGLRPEQVETGLNERKAQGAFRARLMGQGNAKASPAPPRPSAGGAPQAPKRGVASAAHIQLFAQKNGITFERAKKQATDEGWEVR